MNHRPTRSADPTGTPAGTVPPTGLTSPIGRTTLTGPAISTGLGDSGDQPGESRAGSPRRRSRPGSATPIGGVGGWGGRRGGLLRGRFAAPRSAAPVTTGSATPIGGAAAWGGRRGGFLGRRSSAPVTTGVGDPDRVAAAPGDRRGGLTHLAFRGADHHPTALLGVGHE